MTQINSQSRLEQLESVKQFISLKSYNAIQEKLHAEEAHTRAVHGARGARAARENVAQALPRDTFEERHMLPKVIRID